MLLIGAFLLLAAANASAATPKASADDSFVSADHDADFRFEAEVAEKREPPAPEPPRVDLEKLLSGQGIVDAAAPAAIPALFGKQAIEAMLTARQLGAEGVVLFDHSLFADHMDRFRAEVFTEPAVPPTMPWRTHAP